MEKEKKIRDEYIGYSNFLLRALVYKNAEK
jgi:hypothetical protein